MKKLALVAALALAAQGALAQSKVPEMKATGTPGKAEATRLIKITATVVSVDKAARTLTLKHKDGQLETLKAGPEVKRFDEVAAGDSLVVEYEEGLALEFQAPGTAPVAPEAVAASARADKDQAPGGVVAAGVRATVSVTAIDLPNRMVVFQGPGGQFHQVKAGPKVQLEKLKVGDKLLATYVQAVAISLEKAPAPAAAPAKDAKPAAKPAAPAAKK
jgi:Cu/Ag efflux protein CusF